MTLFGALGPILAALPISAPTYALSEVLADHYPLQVAQPGFSLRRPAGAVA